MERWKIRRAHEVSSVGTYESRQAGGSTLWSEVDQQARSMPRRVMQNIRVGRDQLVGEPVLPHREPDGCHRSELGLIWRQRLSDRGVTGRLIRLHPHKLGTYIIPTEAQASVDFPTLQG